MAWHNLSIWPVDRFTLEVGCDHPDCEEWRRTIDVRGQVDDQVRIWFLSDIEEQHNEECHDTEAGR